MNDAQEEIQNLREQLETTQRAVIGEAVDYREKLEDRLTTIHTEWDDTLDLYVEVLSTAALGGRISNRHYTVKKNSVYRKNSTRSYRDMSKALDLTKSCIDEGVQKRYKEQVKSAYDLLKEAKEKMDYTTYKTHEIPEDKRPQIEGHEVSKATVKVDVEQGFKVRVYKPSAGYSNKKTHIEIKNNANPSELAVMAPANIEDLAENLHKTIDQETDGVISLMEDAQDILNVIKNAEAM